MVSHDRENKHDFVKTVPDKCWNLYVFSKTSPVSLYRFHCNVHPPSPPLGDGQMSLECHSKSWVSCFENARRGRAVHQVDSCPFLLQTDQAKNRKIVYDSFTGAAFQHERAAIIWLNPIKQSPYSIKYIKRSVYIIASSFHMCNRWYFEQDFPRDCQCVLTEWIDSWVIPHLIGLKLNILLNCGYRHRLVQRCQISKCLMMLACDRHNAKYTYM